MWWLPFAEFFGEKALQLGISFLEKKYPGIKPAIDKIVKWLEGEGASSENLVPMIRLNNHLGLLQGKK